MGTNQTKTTLLMTVRTTDEQIGRFFECFKHAGDASSQVPNSGQKVTHGIVIENYTTGFGGVFFIYFFFFCLKQNFWQSLSINKILLLTTILQHRGPLRVPRRQKKGQHLQLEQLLFPARKAVLVDRGRRAALPALAAAALLSPLS